MTKPTFSLSIKASEFYRLATRGDKQGAAVLVKQWRTEGMSVQRIYVDVFEPALYEVGRRWECAQITVAQEHLATAVVQSMMASLYSDMFRQTEVNGPIVLAAAVGENLHEVGIRMVADVLETSGFNAFYLGANVPVDQLVSAVEEHRPAIFALSIALPSQLAMAARSIKAIRDACGDHRILIAVGGCAVRGRPAIAEELGADFSANDALSTVATASHLVFGKERLSA